MAWLCANELGLAALTEELIKIWAVEDERQYVESVCFSIACRLVADIGTLASVDRRVVECVVEMVVLDLAHPSQKGGYVTGTRPLNSQRLFGAPQIMVAAWHTNVNWPT